MATPAKDYYRLLGVERDASEENIRSAYRNLAQQYDPDLNPRSDNAETRFKDIQRAYEVLSDPQKREKYDSEEIQTDDGESSRSYPSEVNVNKDDSENIQRAASAPFRSHRSPFNAEKDERVDAEVRIGSANPFAITWTSIKDVYDELYRIIGMNLMWFAVSAVMFVVINGIIAVIWGESIVASFAIGVTGLILVIGPNPAAAGLHYFTRHIVKDEILHFSFFWEGLRMFWRKATLIFLICLGVTGILLVNMGFYFERGADNVIFTGVAVFIGWVMVVWLMMQPYMLPMLIEQEDKRVLIVLRNSLLLAVDNIVLSIFALLVFALFALVPMLFGFPLIIATFGGGLVAMMSQRMTLGLIPKYKSRAGEGASA
jgi:hypothetical protein